ncbi:MAG: cytochrome c oxidase subunit II [Limisphaerales bacterium]
MWRIASSGLLLVLGGAMLLAGCSERQSTLHPAGPQAQRLDELWWLFFWVCTVVFILVIGVLWLAMRRSPAGEDKTSAPTDVNRRMTWVITGSILATAVILFVFLIASVMADRDLASLQSADPVEISVTGHRWWWDVRYESPEPSRMVRTANEIHIPVGRPVRIKLTSLDVIHSFWVPNLHGKKDLTPGREAELWLQADREGVFEGQCAEYCGLQHARMRFLVIAQTPEKFEEWLEHQRQSGRAPQTESEKRGQEVFLSNTCVLCHAVRGTPAMATVAPDLTHIGSRRTLGANIIPNTRGHLGGWIVDPQQIKPGNLMPPNSIDSEDLHALLDYLMSLK